MLRKMKKYINRIVYEYVIHAKAERSFSLLKRSLRKDIFFFYLSDLNYFIFLMSFIYLQQYIVLAVL